MPGAPCFCLRFVISAYMVPRTYHYPCSTCVEPLTICGCWPMTKRCAACPALLYAPLSTYLKSLLCVFCDQAPMSVEACFALGKHLWLSEVTRRLLDTKNPDEALQYLQKAAERGIDSTPTIIRLDECTCLRVCLCVRVRVACWGG